MRTTEIFAAIGEYFAEGLFEDFNAPYVLRQAHAIRCSLQKLPLLKYEGTRLYPTGGDSIWNPGNAQKICFFYPHTVRIRNTDATIEELREKVVAKYPDDAEIATRMLYTALDDVCLSVKFLRGWTHCVINYERFLNEGLEAYSVRIQNARSKNPELSDAMAEVLQAIRSYIRRCREMLLENGASHELVEAFRQMEDGPARNLYEAFVFYNFIWYIDDRDTGGHIDRCLQTFRKGETDEFISQLFEELWKNYDLCEAWHVIYDVHSPLFKIAIRAQRKFSRPNCGIFIDDDTSADTWNEIFESWSAGNPNPSLYSYKNYTDNLESRWNISPDDIKDVAYGGCTELMIQGKSNTGSTDGRLYALQVLAETGYDFPSFREYHDKLIANIDDAARKVITKCEMGHKVAAEYQPNIIRSIFVEDCIDNGVEFNNCGARYNSGLIGITGLTNMVNSVQVVKMCYDGRLGITIQQLKQAIEANFKGFEPLHKKILAAPKFGNDIPEVDELAKELFHKLAVSITSRSTDKRKYFPFINLFTTYINEGSYIPATPDGRFNGDPVGDSFGAVQGTDINGPTALLKSVTNVEQLDFFGTPVLNIRLDKSLLATDEGRAKVQQLIMAYFHRGGLEIQVSILDEEAMKDAMIHPEKHTDLRVRIGGYTEYFVRLTPKLQQEVMKRVIQSL